MCIYIYIYIYCIVESTKNNNVRLVTLITIGGKQKQNKKNQKINWLEIIHLIRICFDDVKKWVSLTLNVREFSFANKKWFPILSNINNLSIVFVWKLSTLLGTSFGWLVGCLLLIYLLKEFRKIRFTRAVHESRYR